jgi:OOP family OmpA-OmpF porin
VSEGADLSPYLGGSIGRGVEIEAADDVESDSSDSSFKFFGGIGIGENFAVEIGYHDFGTTTCCGPSYADFGFKRNGDAFSASALAVWPISRFRLFVKAGGVDLLAGMGGDIAVVSGLRIRLEWERLTIDDDDADSATIGVLWHF